MATKKTGRLQPLKGSDFEMGKNQPDIRGWEVRDDQGRKIGDVAELILDSTAHKVRYIVVDVLDNKELQLDKRTVMVPIGLAQLHPHDHDVLLHGVNVFQLRALPSYRKEDLGAKSEMAIATVFGRQYTSTNNDTDSHMATDFYEHDHFNEKGLWHNQQPSVTHSKAYEQRQVSDAEAASLRQDAELGVPVSNYNPDFTGDNRSDAAREEEELQKRHSNKGKGPRML